MWEPDCEFLVCQTATKLRSVFTGSNIKCGQWIYNCECSEVLFLEGRERV